MERITELLNQGLPWFLLLMLFLFTMIVISNVYGIYKAKKVDPTLRLSLNKSGKVLMGILYGLYILILVYTIVLEIQIFTNTELAGGDKMTLALGSINALTVITLLAALEFQDIFFIGDKNIFISNRMYEIRRMRKISFPKKHLMVFVYGQKEYNYSTRFVDMQVLKPKLRR